MAEPRHICVIGAGIIGLGSALRLCEELDNVHVTVVADKFEADTTSAGAAGLWEPYKLSDTPVELVTAWASETYEYLQRLLLSSEAGPAGVAQATGHQFWTEPGNEVPEWASAVPHFRHMTPREIAPYNETVGGGIAEGWAFTTLICEGGVHLPWLKQRVLAAGARIEQRKISSLQELAGYDLVMNCSGLGAATLFGDTSMFPIRGHVLRVRAPWIKGMYFLDAETYIIPNAKTVVLGGTGQVGDYSIEPRKEDRDSIWQRCLKLMPSLEKAEYLREWVGLRPGRPSVRLERETLRIPGSSTVVPVVHNYGHGGAGITLHWGCAGHAVRLAREGLAERAARARL